MLSRSALILALLAFALLRPQRARAQEEPYRASATATRTSFEHSRSVVVVTRKDADETGAGNVGDMLERAPGVVVQRTASGSAVPILRGLTGYQVLLMLDDMRLNDALTRAGGGASLNLVDPEAVMQIDVVRGPASVLYGSDALGGVVHVRTMDTGARTAKAPTFSAGAALRGASAEQAARAQGAVGGAWAGVGLRLSAGRGYAGALYRGGELGAQPFTGHEDWTASGKLEGILAPGHRLSLAYHSGHIFDMPRSDVSQPDDIQKTLSLDRDASVLTYTGRVLDRRVRLHSYLGISARREHRQRLRPGRDQHEQERVRSLQAGLRASSAPWFGASLELGVDATLDRIDSSAYALSEGERMNADRGRYVDGSRYDQYALYALLTQQLSRRVTLLFGARAALVIAQAPPDPAFVDALGSGAALDRRFVWPVASLGTRVQLLPALSLVTSVLGGYRAPNLEDFQAFGGAARGYTVPNLSLGPEHSWTFEGGLEYLDDAWDVRAYGFATLLSGLIVRVPTTLDGMSVIDDEPVIGRRNASQSLLTGGELSATRVFDLGLFGSFAAALTWGKSERPDDEGRNLTEPAAKVAPPVVVLRGGFDKANVPYFGSLALTLQAEQTRLSEGDRLDVRLCPRGPSEACSVPGFAELTLRVGIRLARVLVSVSAENLLNKAYRTYGSGAYAPGRNFIAALRVAI